MDNKYTYKAIFPKQAEGITVFSFVASASDINKIARIERASRDENGSLSGFQRPQILNHIKEIKNYLNKPDAILPNSIVVAFTKGIEIESKNGFGSVSIDISNGPPGWIVDGQQRYSALLQIEKKFDFFVSAFVCASEEELNKQFILINNTKPLPKSLIYELLPKVRDLPDRLSSRSTAAEIVELLNFRADSCLKGMIKQQTNPLGIISDTSIQKVIINSLSDGALRLLYNCDNFQEKAFNLINGFYSAVSKVFPESWQGHKPKTSRLVHGAGIISMGYVMEYLFNLGARTEEDFIPGLQSIKNQTAWTSGNWNFAVDDCRKWNSIQHVPRDILQLSNFLTAELKKQYDRLKKDDLGCFLAR